LQNREVKAGRRDVVVVAVVIMLASVIVVAVGARMSNEKEGPSMIPLADFDACVLDAPIAALNKVDMTAISLAYLQAATTPSPFKEVFRFLSEITGIHLSPAERGKIWGPGMQLGDRRSMIPSDIRGKQSDVLVFMLTTQHCGPALPTLCGPTTCARVESRRPSPPRSNDRAQCPGGRKSAPAGTRQMIGVFRHQNLGDRPSSAMIDRVCVARRQQRSNRTTGRRREPRRA
jgi:hypothetical protein